MARYGTEQRCSTGMHTCSVQYFTPCSHITAPPPILLTPSFNWQTIPQCLASSQTMMSLRIEVKYRSWQYVVV